MSEKQALVKGNLRPYGVECFINENTLDYDLDSITPVPWHSWNISAQKDSIGGYNYLVVLKKRPHVEGVE